MRRRCAECDFDASRTMNNLCNELRLPSISGGTFDELRPEINTHTRIAAERLQCAAVAACKLQFRCRENKRKRPRRRASSASRAATFYSIFYCSIIKKRDFAAYLITLPGAKAAAAATLFSSFAPSKQEKLNFAAAARVSFFGPH
jgi:hypothetical protein